MQKHFQLQKLQGFARTQTELTAKENSTGRQTLEKSLDVEFSEDALTTGHYKEVRRLLANFRAGDCDIEECLTELEDLHQFLESGLQQHEKKERPAGLSDASLVADDLVRDGFVFWLGGLEELLDALHQDEEHRIGPALEQLKEGNHSLAKLDLLLREQGVTESDAAAAKAQS